MLWSLYITLLYTHIYVIVLKSGEIPTRVIWNHSCDCRRRCFVIYRLKEIVHTAPLFNELKILIFGQLYYVSVLICMDKFYHKTLPDIFSNFYICHSDIHSYNTKQHLCYHVPITRLTQTSRNIQYIGVNRHAFMSIISYCFSFATYEKSITIVLLSNGNINSVWIMIYFIHTVIPLCYLSNQMIGILSIRCGAILARSIFSKILALDTP